MTVGIRVESPPRRPLRLSRRAWVVGPPSTANRALRRAFAGLGFRAALAGAVGEVAAGPGDLVLARLGVLPTLDGVDPGLWELPRLERRGVRVLNRPAALLAAHDGLSTALLLGRAGVPHARTALVGGAAVPHGVAPPYVVAPRFGARGREAVRCTSEQELLDHLGGLRSQRWFRRHGALVQELLPQPPARVVVAGGRVVGSAPGSAAWPAVRAVAALGLDLAGVDVAFRPDGRPVVVGVDAAADLDEGDVADALAALVPAVAR